MMMMVLRVGTWKSQVDRRHRQRASPVPPHPQFPAVTIDRRRFLGDFSAELAAMSKAAYHINVRDSARACVRSGVVRTACTDRTRARRILRKRSTGPAINSPFAEALKRKR